MRYSNWILGMVFLTGLSSFSQEKYTKHTVSKGETITKIAQQYHVKTSAIYELNPDAKKGIKFHTVLLIPSTTVKGKIATTEITTNFPEKTHTVLSKETLYGIAKQYGVTVNDLYKSNPALEKSGLKKGQKITIPGNELNTTTQQIAVQQPVKENPKTTVPEKTPSKKETETNSIVAETTTDGIVREIQPSETKYAIAKEYGITVADLDKANPILETEALKIGQKIIIPVKPENSTKPIATVDNNNNNNNKTVTEKVILDPVQPVVLDNKIVETSVITREVLPKETKYGIAKEFGISVKELERQNPKIVKRLPVGYKLSIHSLKIVEPVIVKEVIAETSQTPDYNVKGFHGTDFLDQLVSTASENIGTRYRTGGTTKEGFDCSGLMCTTFGAFDIDLPRTSIEQSRYGVKINNEDAQKGDLIFFKTNGRRQINHVGMVVEVNDGDIKFIHASVGGGVIISSIKEKYYSKKLTQINRVL
ncbi:LysM peptidoglycan-binding domain-containing protein [Flavobacterium sp. WC2421]|uniref:LysM peptidoglycan-binding domain-containing protein n=1 Tax=Flavobacterium sp. WC2409 TaxID=3234139 RepID=A0AB39W162_9FLAO